MAQEVSRAWQAVFQDWAAMAATVSALHDQLRGDDAAASVAELDRTTAESLRLLEEELDRKREAMDECLVQIRARHMLGYRWRPGARVTPPKLRRLAVGSEPCEGGFTWQLVAMYEDGVVVFLDRGQQAFASPDLARAAGMAFAPEHLR